MSRSRIACLSGLTSQSKERRNQMVPFQSSPDCGSIGQRSPGPPELPTPLSELAGYEVDPCRNQFEGSRMTGQRESFTPLSAKDVGPLFGRNRHSPARSTLRADVTEVCAEPTAAKQAIPIPRAVVARARSAVMRVKRACCG